MEMKVTLNGIEQTIANQELYDLAAKGLIGPNTIIHVDGKPFPAGQAKGIVFGSPTGTASTSDGQGFELPKRSDIQKQHEAIISEEKRKQEEQIARQQEQIVQQQGPIIEHKNEPRTQGEEARQKLLSKYDFRLIASRQKFLISSIGVAIISGCIGIVFPPMFLVAIVSGIVAMFACIYIADSLQYGPVTCFITALFLLIPVVRLIVMLISREATNLLAAAGFHVGFFGTDLRQFTGQKKVSVIIHNDADSEKTETCNANQRIKINPRISKSQTSIFQKDQKSLPLMIGVGALTLPLLLFLFWLVSIPFLDRKYDNHTSVSVTTEEAEILRFRKDARDGDATAQNNLGVRYLEGDGVPQDYQEAIKWFQKAVEKGHSLAQLHLAYCYENGYGVEKDLKEAANWFRKAAEQDNEYAQYRLASCYEDGNGIEEDFVEAMKWYRKVAERDSSEPVVVQAQYVLGVGYYEGIGVEEDEDEAKKWLEKAAKGGNQDAVELLKEGFDDEEPK